MSDLKGASAECSTPSRLSTPAPRYHSRRGTPILLGCAAFVILPLWTSDAALSTGVSIGAIFGLRALAIYRHSELSIVKT